MTWLTLVSVAAAALIALTPYLLGWWRRRKAKAASAGTVATSQAGELWKTSMDLIARLQEENSKLVQQRDRLVALMDDKIAPALESIAATQHRDGETLAALQALLEGGAHADQAPAGLE